MKLLHDILIAVIVLGALCVLFMCSKPINETSAFSPGAEKQVGRASPPASVPTNSFEMFFEFLGDESYSGRVLEGEDGEHGFYFLTEPFWIDGCEQLGVNPESNEWYYATNVYDSAKCERVILAYFERYCPEALRNRDFGRLAAVFHNGPRAAKAVPLDDYGKRAVNYTEEKR